MGLFRLIRNEGLDFSEDLLRRESLFFVGEGVEEWGFVCFGCLLAVGGSFVVGVLRVDYLDFVLRRIFTLNYFIFA